MAVAGHASETRLGLTDHEIAVPLSDTEIAVLRNPTYSAVELGYEPLHPDAMLSPRVAPQMIGLGLLEAIPAADILAFSDPEDTDGDGIAGRPNSVCFVKFNQPMLGHFGLKAAANRVRHHRLVRKDAFQFQLKFVEGWRHFGVQHDVLVSIGPCKVTAVNPALKHPLQPMRCWLA